MKTTITTYGVALALTCSLTTALKAQNLYIGTEDNDTVGKYGPDGSTLNASLLSVPGEPDGIAISSGPNVFPVPEPSTVALAGLGLGLGAALCLRRRAG